MSIRAGADGRFDLHGGDEGAYEDGTDGVARAGRSIAAAPRSEEGVAMGAEDGRKRERGEERESEEKSDLGEGDKRPRILVLRAAHY